MPRPTASEVISDIGPMLIGIRECVRHGLKKARQYFDGEDEKPDPWLGPDLVRWNAKRVLDRGGHAAANLEEDYERTPASNNGLRILYKNYLILVRKSDDGLLPVPASDIQRGMYNANLDLFESSETRQTPATTTLAVLWDCDREYDDLTSLVLALPKTGGDTRETTEAYWYEPILHLGDAQQDLDYIQRRDDEEQGAGETE